MFKILNIVLLFITFFINSCDLQKNKSLIAFDGQTMGTTFTVKFVIGEYEINQGIIEKDINDILIEVNRQMSTYISDSEISMFNNYDSTDWFSISPDFMRVVKSALLISRQSSGAFDITIGPLVNLWGFGPEVKDIKIPSVEELELAKSKIGYSKLDIDTVNLSIRKKLKEIYIDLSAIAKGFGVDKICGYLEENNIENYMVEIGGELRASGKNNKDEYWNIGIEKPDETGNLQEVIALNDYAVATSGDYQNYIEVDGKRFSHTIDGRTGFPITHSLASVSVIHKSCMMADGYATAINVMGSEQGYQFALQLELPVLMIVKDGNEFIEKSTKQFDYITDKK